MTMIMITLMPMILGWFLDECFVAGGRLGGWAVKFGPRVKCGSPDCHLLPRDHPKQQQQQPLLQQQLQQLQLQQPRQQQLQRRQPLNMEEGKTGLTTLTTNTGDLAKKTKILWSLLGNCMNELA